VIAEESRGGWRWFRISWINQPPSIIGNKNIGMDGWYRLDNLVFFDPKAMMSDINNLFLEAGSR
jgi:hypothetical protein